MATETVKAKLQEQSDDEAVAVQYDFGGDLDGAVDRFGPDVVFNRFKSAVTIDVQSLIRRHLRKDPPSPVEEIQAEVDGFLPGVSTRTRKSKKEKAMEIFENMTPEEKEAFLASLQ